jgi:cytochrome P450
VNLDVVSIYHDPAISPAFAANRTCIIANGCADCLVPQQTLKPYSFLGFGQRMCPGMSLARSEICVFVRKAAATPLK